MDPMPKEPQTKKEYVQPTLQEREHVDEVVWGQPITTIAVML